MVVEDDAGVGAFAVGILSLAVVEGEGAQVVGHFLCAADGDVADGEVLVVVPYAEAVAEVFGHIDLWVGDEGFLHCLEAFRPVQGKALYVLLVLAPFLVGEDVPAAFVGSQLVGVQDGFVGRFVYEFLIGDAQFALVAQCAAYQLQIAGAGLNLFWLDEFAQISVLLQEHEVLDALQQVVGERVEFQDFGVRDAIVHPVGCLYLEAEEVFDAFSVGCEHVAGEVAPSARHFQPSVPKLFEGQTRSGCRLKLLYEPDVELELREGMSLVHSFLVKRILFRLLSYKNNTDQ